MAELRTYSATVSEAAPLVHLRLNETGGTTASDTAGGLTGAVRLDAASIIGNGAMGFAGTADFIRIDTLSGAITVTAFGDSLIDGDTGGFQEPADQFAVDLETALDDLGLDATVIDRGFNGDTTGEGLARLDDVVGDQADVVIVEFGTNDAIQEIDPATAQDNLTSIIDGLSGRQVLLTSAFAFYPERNGGVGYDTEAARDAFEQIFPDLAAGTPAVLLDDAAGSDKFLGGAREGEAITGGVLGDPALNVDDGLHPNAAGVDQIVERVLPQTVALGAAAGALTDPLLLGQGSFEAWFVADDVTGDHYFLAKNAEGGGTGGHMAAGLRDGRARFVLGDETGNFIAQSDAPVIEAGAPTHMVATFGAAGIQVYVNGELVAENPYTGGLDAGLGNFEPLIVGGDVGDNVSLSPIGRVDDPFDGIIDEVVVYDRALLPNEVQALFDSGRSGTSLVGTRDPDLLIGGDDDESFVGRAGADQVRGNGGADNLRGSRGADDLQGGPGDDIVSGGKQDDVVRGGAADDLLEGGRNGDVLRGGPGNDTLRGGGGSDRLFGGQGDDLLLGGLGRDALTGGDGSDVFRIIGLEERVDRVFDFETGVGFDQLDLASLLDGFDDANANDFLRLNETSTGNTKVQADVDGAGGDFVNVFNLVGQTGLDLEQLITDGNINVG